MAVIVCFMKPGGLGSIHATGIGPCRVRETLTVPATTTASAQDGEIAVLVSTEAATVLAAVGSTPSATATDATPATGAGFPVPPGLIVPAVLAVGAKVSVAALS